ncbi:hypothetical protein DPMN_083597 [Dreissena polymorpha]|uniref:Uncharacterized protein n=1 Tax=Dreissena polymorpha TaxID=45954 RepID=A0A9D3YCR3_DREPO|nr:hypothetical protein DPMN_083597 [Dreissena polymorpha]
MRSLEDDLRETTRKLIENSQQFSRFANRTSRPKLSIGLAQPQQRQTLKTPKATEISGEQHLGNLTSNAERLRMAQSPWASENSPPMDLDYENSDIERALYPGRQSNRDIERALYPGEEDVTNRMAMTSSTPSKKRRLTYQKMPGRRGQTKLVFE